MKISFSRHIGKKSNNLFKSFWYKKFDTVLFPYSCYFLSYIQSVDEDSLSQTDPVFFSLYWQSLSIIPTARNLFLYMEVGSG